MESLREDKDMDQFNGMSRLKTNKRTSLTLCLNKPGKNFAQTVVGLKVCRDSKGFGFIPEERFHPI